ncbi:MAG: DUF169 domain-containing protein [Desulfatibacillaceae bacterium]
MRFCEAVTRSRRAPITLTPDLLDCQGGLRSLGWAAGDVETIAEMARETGMPQQYMETIVQHTPRLPAGIKAVTVGSYEDADLAISFTQPKAAMHVVRNWQLAFGQPVVAPISCFMGVCGSVAARAYVSGELSLSFGCPHSRECAGIGRDRLVLGVPSVLMRTLVAGRRVEEAGNERRETAARLRHPNPSRNPADRAAWGGAREKRPWV